MKRWQSYFNTSHVNVNPPWTQSQLRRFCNFNTSHVNVNPGNIFPAIPKKPHFNTSHVNVNLFSFRKHRAHLWISIHLMLMLIRKKISKWKIKYNFNTSHVNVNPQKLWTIRAVFRDFNTSHVNVNRRAKGNPGAYSVISIHLMLMLI